MKPVLFPADSTVFKTLGIGVLTDASSCIVTEERNGVYELQMQYPITGPHYNKIRNRCIIYAEVNQDKNRQPFRIYRITKPLRGIVTIYAQHISYDLSGIVLVPFSVNAIQAAMTGISKHSSTENPFTFSSDKQTTAVFSVSQPSTVRSIMGGQAGSLLDVYGGEYEYDHFNVKLLNSRGKNNGVTIRYGKNLIDLTQEENIQSVYTGVYPFWTQEDSYVELPEKIIFASGTFGFSRVRPLDTSSHFQEKPTVAQLRSYAESFMESNQIGVPAVSISVKFAALEQTEEYKNLAPLQRVSLCDTVTVIFEQLGVHATAKCIKTVYDTLKGRYKEIVLGDAKTNITDTIAGQKDFAIQVAQSEAYKAVSGQTQMDIFNKLTNYGRVQGIYIQDDQWYINAEVVKVLNLIADAVQSVNGNNTMILDSASLVLKMTQSEKKNVWITNVNDGYPILYMFDTEGDAVSDLTELSPHHLKIGGSSADPAFQVSLNIGKSDVAFDSLSPSGDGNCVWEYDNTLGKTILVKR